ncbi:hypothetical protein BOV86_005155 [Escherichia coli]|nr:hypothetical protein [Escherichia coli]
MLLIQPGFGLSIKKGHMFGEKESQRKMVSIRLPFISIYWLNREATNYWYTCARAAFNDPDWFVKTPRSSSGKEKGQYDIHEGVSKSMERTPRSIPTRHGKA